MGRRLQVNECLICGETPCACKAVKSRNPAPVRSRNPSPVKVIPKALRAPVTTPAPPSAPRKLTVEGDEDLHRALRVLAAAGLMGVDDRKKYGTILSGIPVEDRAAAWRARREARHGNRPSN